MPAGTRTHMDLTQKDKRVLLETIAAFPHQRVVVWGDFVADEFLYGEISRVSREAPVLILKHRKSYVVPGGGANAAYNIASLGAQVIPVGVVGRDEAGRSLLSAFARKGIPISGVLRPTSWLTTTKTRILAGSAHSQRQQIVRVDREPEAPLLPRFRERLERTAEKHLSKATALLISDYGYGAVDARSVARLCLRKALGNSRTKTQRNLPVTVDARYHLFTYCGLTAATPNEPEIEEAFGISLGNQTQQLRTLGQKLLGKLKYRALVVTRGRDGMVIFERHKAPHFLPIFGSDEVADVTGAGDTVIAAFTLALAAGAGYLDAARIANCAAGLVVMKRGTATVSQNELEEAIRRA